MESRPEVRWLRLKRVGAFDGSWTKERLARELPGYRFQDIGYVFFVYDYKYSGEHRVRLVFNGSQQGESTFEETFAPTVRPESVRLFHAYCIEYDYAIRQFDVPQAFLQSEVEHDIFFYPPRGFAEFPGQIFKCLRNLYGTKEAARLWFKAFAAFLLEIGFESTSIFMPATTDAEHPFPFIDSMDPCLFRRREQSGLFSIAICHVDDSRIGSTPELLEDIWAALFQRFGVTECPGDRFLGMDVFHDQPAGILVLYMRTYIEETVKRFEECDTSAGFPFRELVGCLLWICQVHGPELMRVKDLARRGNDYTARDYGRALRVLRRMVSRKQYGITFRKGGAYRERVPSSSRKGGELQDESGVEVSDMEPYSIGDKAEVNELEVKDLFRESDFERGDLRPATNVDETDVFRIVAYTDAAFAVDEKMQSVSGWIVYLNGAPIIFGSMKQTVVVDSSCSAEYVAASICVKKVKEFENMLEFLEIRCKRPHRVYTDSTACKSIATNPNKMGNVRHLAIRTHLIRCYVTLGDVELVYCTTESMVADLMTKIVCSAQDTNLALRFYNDCEGDLPEMIANSIEKEDNDPEDDVDYEEEEVPAEDFDHFAAAMVSLEEMNEANGVFQDEQLFLQV